MADNVKKFKEMAKKVDTYKYPSLFGSHKSMVVKELTEEVVVCKDDYGEYKTYKSRLDDGMADPYRFDLEMRVVNLHKLEKEKK